MVSGLLMSLKPEYREILILREYQNLTYEEIAAVTRSSLSAVKSRLFKARKKMTSILIPEMMDEEESLEQASRVRTQTDSTNS